MAGLSYYSYLSLPSVFKGEKYMVSLCYTGLLFLPARRYASAGILAVVVSVTITIPV